MIQFSEKLQNTEILQLLSRSLPYYLQTWHPQDDTVGLFGSTDPRTYNMRKVGSSSPVIEYVVRPHLQILCILGSYIHQNALAAFSDTSPQETMALFSSGIRWACETHLVGSRDVESFLERKRWGENWRSGLWASLLAIAGYLGASALDGDLLEKIRAVLAFEADRFLGVSPPSGCEIDTKIEENAQDAMVLAWAINTIPDHPHAAEWEKTLSVWALNIASTIQDKADHSACSGRAVSHWVTTQTLFPDLTAENHGFFHPEILSYSAFVVLAKAAYALHQKPAPAILRRATHQRTFDTLLRFVLPNGLIYAPAANDLPMFIPRPLALAWGLWNSDPRAISMTIRLLSWIDEKDTVSKEQGPWVFGFNGDGEGWELLFQSQVGFELAMLAVLPFPEEQRFYSSGQIESAVDTNKIYPFVQICYRRNTRTTRSVAWKALGKHPAIGLSVHAYPELTAPFKASLLGIPSVGTSVKYAEVAFHEERSHRDGFDTIGRILYYGASRELLLRRDLRVLTWSDDGLLIFDRIFSEQSLIFDEQYLSPLYIVNDEWTGNKASFCSGSLAETIRSTDVHRRAMSCPAFWASIEGAVLYQFVWGRTKGLAYVPGNRRNAPRYWSNCRLDMLGVHVDNHTCTAGETLYEVGIFLGNGKSPRPFKSAGVAGDFFRGLVIMDGKNTVGLS